MVINNIDHIDTIVRDNMNYLFPIPNSEGNILY